MEIIKSGEIKKNRQKGITLISLVVTIIILLILAGISIGMLSGDNSILGQAGNAKKQTDIAGEKEILQISAVSAMGKNKYGDITKEKLDNELNSNIGSTNYSSKLVDNGIEVTFTNSGRTYIVDYDGNVELSIAKPKIANSKIVNSLGNEVSEAEEAEQLYIIITPSIDGGTIESLICNEGNTVEKQNDGTYKVAISKNGTYTFKIIGKVDGKESISKSVPIEANGFKMKTALDILKVNTSASTTDEKSPYVKYVDKNENDIICRVLYNDSDKGIQIISINSVDIVKLGKSDPEAQSHGNTDFEKAKWSYNNAINTLNTIALSYLNENLSPIGGARCVGSDPKNPSKENGLYTFPDNYSESAKNIEIKKNDDNYTSDKYFLEKIGALKTEISCDYWLASLYIYSDSSAKYFTGRSMTSSGSLYNANYLCYVTQNGNTEAYDDYEHGLRPVFTIKPEIIITGGDGKTPETAYTLGW